MRSLALPVLALALSAVLGCVRLQHTRCTYPILESALALRIETYWASPRCRLPFRNVPARYRLSRAEYAVLIETDRRAYDVLLLRVLSADPRSLQLQSRQLRPQAIPGGGIVYVLRDSVRADSTVMLPSVLDFAVLDSTGGTIRRERLRLGRQSGFSLGD